MFWTKVAKYGVGLVGSAHLWFLNYLSDKTQIGNDKTGRSDPGKVNYVDDLRLNCVVVKQMCLSKCFQLLGYYGTLLTWNLLWNALWHIWWYSSHISFKLHMRHLFPTKRMPQASTSSRGCRNHLPQIIHSSKCPKTTLGPAVCFKRSHWYYKIYWTHRSLASASN